MRTKSVKKNIINIITLGCSKNIYDSEVLMGQLSANNISVKHESLTNEENIVIINTCGFIDNAKQESIDTILAQAERKKLGLIDKLYVTGCLSERYKPELEKEINNVNQYFGTTDLPKLLKVLGAEYKHELIGERLITTPNHYAYLKISEGCDRPCSFCAIPLMRGKHKSKSIKNLVSETENLAKNGVKELILIAQDLTFYGLDIYNKRRLADLLISLSEVEGIEWIRLHYAFPTGFPNDVLDVIRRNKKICNYIDIPLQHINDKILKSMRRGTSYKKTNKLLKSFRQKVPGIAIRTTLIVGYPGESEDNFKELKEWVNCIKFERLGVFTYSHEENTSAFDLSDDVPEDIKHSRAKEIMSLQKDISLSLNKSKIGKTFKVLFDRKEGEYFIGRTEFDSPDVDNEVLVQAENTYIRIGDFYNILIQKVDHFDLYGMVVD
ncbi:MAG: 30S ribosomal protein S12 methylthiotransferase RimO [Bacteroidota bacterium]|nr:30S ribosomal protein S12 methylthiotransferase RimO [Bacteroidota bacterium]